jgi:hypothetical protein
MQPGASRGVYNLSRVIRSVLAILLGYAVFAVSAVALFAVGGRDPHSQASAGFTIIAIAYGACFGVLAGLVAAWVARRAYFTHAFAVGCIIALGAAISLIARPGEGAIWTQLAAMVLFAPLTLLGAHLRSRISKRVPG